MTMVRPGGAFTERPSHTPGATAATSAPLPPPPPTTARPPALPTSAPGRRGGAPPPPPRQSQSRSRRRSELKSLTPPRSPPRDADGGGVGDYARRLEAAGVRDLASHDPRAVLPGLHPATLDTSPAALAAAEARDLAEANRLAGMMDESYGEAELESLEAELAAATGKRAARAQAATAAHTTTTMTTTQTTDVGVDGGGGPSWEGGAAAAATTAPLDAVRGWSADDTTDDGEGQLDDDDFADDSDEEDDDQEDAGASAEAEAGDDAWEAELDDAAAELVAASFGGGGAKKQQRQQQREAVQGLRGDPADEEDSDASDGDEDSGGEEEEEEEDGGRPPPVPTQPPRRSRGVVMAAAIAAAASASTSSSGRRAVDIITGEAAEPVPAAEAAATAGAAANTASASTGAPATAAAAASLVAAARSLQARLGRAVQAEQAAAVADLKRVYARGSLDALREEGIVLTGLAAKTVARGMGAASVEVRVAGRHDDGPGAPPHPLPPHAFSVRDPVVLAPTTSLRGDRLMSGRGGGGDDDGPGARRAAGPLEGTVAEVRLDRLVVNLHAAGADEAVGAAGPSQAWRLDKTAPDTTSRRQMAALSALDRPWAEVASAPGEGWDGEAWDERQALAARAARDAAGPPPSFSEGWTPGELRVRAVLLGAPDARAAAETPPPWAVGGGGGGGSAGNMPAAPTTAVAAAWSEAAARHLAAEQGLNPSQRAAVAAALTSSVTLWQGPPGTGKTRTLTALLTVLARASRGGGVDGGGGASAAAARAAAVATRAAVPVLACGDTNAAADGLAAGLAAAGVEVVRLGGAAAVGPAAAHLTLDARAAATPLGLAAADARGAARDAATQAKAATRTGDNGRADTMKARASEFRAQADDLTERAKAAVLARAEVVAATTASAGDTRRLGGQRFRCVVLDEATQATEPSLLVPLVRGAECVVMAGDPRQLPPTVQTAAAKAAGLDQTLFERLQRAGLATHLLDTQYRMHPGLAAWPSARFYGGALQTGITADDAPPPAAFPWPVAGLPVVLVETDAGRQPEVFSSARRGGGPARGGAGALTNPGEAVVAVRAAVSLLADPTVRSVAILTPYAAQLRALRLLLDECGMGREARAALMLSTVDGFQGREADAVVFSAVRCNEAGSLGFVADARRMNVALTRARRGLVVVGHPATLASSPDWAAWTAWATDAGALLPAGAVPPAAFEAEAGDMVARFGQGVGVARGARPRLAGRAGPFDERGAGGPPRRQQWEGDDRGGGGGGGGWAASSGGDGGDAPAGDVWGGAPSDDLWGAADGGLDWDDGGGGGGGGGGGSSSDGW